jgi:hypothetical protein
VTRRQPDGTAPRQFSLLVPYASFGWLPAECRLGGQGGTWSGSIGEQLILFAEAGKDSDNTVMLTAYPVGKCRLVGGGLPCTPFNTEWFILTQAPDVAGHKAYWLKGGAGIAWQYAPGGWAELDMGRSGQPSPPKGAQRAAMLRVAANVRFGQTTPLRFPYWLAGRPKGWRLSGVNFDEVTRPRSGLYITLIDAPLDSDQSSRPETIQVWVQQAGPGADAGCGPQPPQRSIPLDGGHAQINPDGTYLCANDLDGLALNVALQEPTRQTAVPGLVLGIARGLHLLGVDPANWTTSPLR